MKQFITITTVLFLSLFSTTFSAQGILDELKKNPNGPSEKDIAKMYESMFGGKVEIPPKYNFDIELTMKMKDEDEETSLNWLISKTENYAGFKGSSDMSEDMGEFAYMVMDYDNEAMVMYMEQEGMKRGMKMAYNAGMGAKYAEQFYSGIDFSEGEISDDKSIDGSGIKITKTGKQPTIAGQKCTEYKVQHDEAEEYSLMSISQQSNIDWINFQKKMGGLDANYGNSGFGFFKEGTLMKVSVYEKKGNKLISDMEVSEIKESKHTINNSDWNFDLGF